MKTKKQLEDLGFLFVTLPTGLIKLSLAQGEGEDRKIVFRTSALTERTVIRRANQWLQEK